MNLTRITIVLSLLLLVAGCATAQKGAMGRAYSAIKDGRYESALARLSEAEKYVPPTPELQAEISFMRGKSYEGMKNIPEAIGSYRYVVETFPKSIYAFQAKERLKVLDTAK
jgi:outer membrane protein assembly factor BamD (BamD/ComL family)